MTTDPSRTETLLRDEIKQLRTALEGAEGKAARLRRDRHALSERLERQAREYRLVRSEHDRLLSLALPDTRSLLATAVQGQTEEELRVALEELQVVAEELEASNQQLHDSNRALEGRVRDRTRELSRVNAELLASEATFRAVANLIPDLVLRAGRSGDVQWANDRWFEYTGQLPEEALEAGWLAPVHPSERPAARRDWQATVAAGRSLVREYRLKGAAGYRWFLLRFEPTRDEAGEVVGWYGAVTDTHEQHLAFQALRASEVRFRTLVEGIPQLVWRSRRDGQWTWSSPQWISYTGQAMALSLGHGWLRAVHPEDRDKATAAWDATGTGRFLDVELRILGAAENRFRHFSVRAMPVMDEDGRLTEWLGTCTDMDDMLRLRNQQGVLVAELQHRTRNLMSVVQSIIARTLKTAPSLKEFREKVQIRLDALARVQGLLSGRVDGTRITFDQLLHAELAAHLPAPATDPASQVRLSGPPGIDLRSAKVQVFALALHELTTNAIKYGALSTPSGRLHVSWSLEVREAVSHLVVNWHESGVGGLPPPGTAPRGGGQGRELIEKALPYQLDARTRFRLEADGLRCLIDVPLD